MSDWTTSESISKPDKIVITYKNTLPDGTEEEKEVTLMSSTRSVSKSTYKSIGYIDRDGKIQQSEVQVLKNDTTYNTIASVNQSYITWRLNNKKGLPSGSAESVTTTTTEYRSTTEGVRMVRETTDAYISEAQFAGGLQIENYEAYNPSGSPDVLSHRTIREVEELKTNEGREVTRTKTSRWMARGESSEGKTDFAAMLKALKPFISLNPSIVKRLVNLYTEIIFEGTEVQVEVGRMPVPEKPPDQDLVGDEIENGSDSLLSDSTPLDVYGNDDGWTGYIPEGDNWQNYVGDGANSWEDYVPKTWEDYDTEDNDWEKYVPEDPKEYDKDSDNDGLSDWTSYVPDKWQDYDTDTDGDGTPDWAIYVPTTWQEYNRDSDVDGIPDWAAYVDGDWQALNKDSNGDGVPDWASEVPTTWQELDQDSDDDGEPDWVPFVPVSWRDFNDTDSNGVPLWEPFVPVGPEDFNQDSDDDGEPDWAPLVPTGDDFDTSATDYIGTQGAGL